MDRSEPPHLSIWIVNPFDDIPGEGLPPQRCWSLARVLAGRGHDVTWWTASWSNRRKAARATPLAIRDDEGFAVRLVAVRPYAKNISLARLASHRDFGRTFERLASEAVASGQLDRPDLILASLPPLEGPEAAARLARRLDAAVVVDLMDAWPEAFAGLVPGPQWLRDRLASLLIGRMITRRQAVLATADAVSSCAQGYLDLMAGPVGAERPRHVCHHGAWLPEFPPPPRLIDHVPVAGETADHGAEAAPPPLACVFSGTLESAQEIDTLVAAARLLSSRGVAATLHVAGTGRLEAGLRSAAAAVGGSCAVRVHGLLDRGAYVRLLSECDVGLVLARPQSLVMVPYKACDYAAAGLAVVNPLPGELAELLERHRAGVAYAAGSGDSLARAVESLAVDRRLLMQLRAGARRLAEAEFDREKTYARFADWLEGISRPEPGREPAD
jgi:glycosyltransferase involved in cell wall biosynthesis